jgi:hypothetical protein
LDIATGRVTTSEGSIAGRVDIYRVALSEVAERPLFGVGPDNFVVAYPRHRSPNATQLHESDAPQTSPHSWLLKVATDAGGLGLVAYAVMLGIAFWTAARKRDVAFAGLAMVVSFLATGMISISDVGTEWLLWAGLGLIAVPTLGETTDAAVVSGRRRGQVHTRVVGPRAALGWVAIALGIALSLLQLNALDASRAAALSRQARSAVTPSLSVAKASGQRAVSLDAGRPEYWHELGLALAANEEFRAAEVAFERAAEAAPHQVVYVLNLAKAQVAIGQSSGGANIAEALTTARRAAELDPLLADVHYTLALASYVNGLHAEAAEASEHAWAIRPSPGTASGFEVPVRAYRQLGRPSDAERWVRAAIASLGNSLEWQLELTELLLEQGRTAEALTQVDLVLASYPNDAAARTLREMIVSAGSR